MSEFDVAAFVRQLTDEVWNRKMVGLLYERATSNILVHYSSHEERYGRETLIHDTIRELAAFPDFQVTVDRLLWQAERDGSYRVSMQQTWQGRNSGYSLYGPPTDREVSQQRLVNARIVGGRVAELWIASDERGLLQQLGLEPEAVLYHLEAVESGQAAHPAAFPPIVGEIERGRGQVGPAPLPSLQGSSPAARLIQQSQHDIWNRRLVGAVQDHYAEGYTGRWSGGRTLDNREQVQALVLAYLAMFPDFSFHLDHLIEPEHAEEGPQQVAASWTWLGSYSGPGHFGRPTHQRVRATGISHYTLEEGRILHEVTESNDFRLFQQVAQLPLSDLSAQGGAAYDSPFGD